MGEDMKIEPLVVREEFAVNPEMLYRAWTEEEPLKEWWQPMGTALRSVRADIQPGGDISYDFVDADFRVTGKYEAVEPASTLRYSWNWEYGTDQLKNESFILDISFQEQGDGTLLSIRQEGFKNEEEREAHEQGWRKGLQQLREYFTA